MSIQYTQILRHFCSTLLVVLLCGISASLYASHAQGADLTYTCLGGNQYRVRLSFYRDCSGAPAPTVVNISVSSVSQGQFYAISLSPIAGTGQDVTPICSGNQTVCSGGGNPGVQEYIYEATTTLPMASRDWVFGFVFCCRNSAINTIVNPGGQNIYIQACLNNIDAPGNNSPAFSNRPVPYASVAQSYNFNHGAIDVDGDSLVYSVVSPATSPTSTVSYISPYSANQPLASTPAMTCNSTTGDIAMTPSQLLVTVMAVRVDEWRKGVLIGSVVRDIQLKVISNGNVLPRLSGMNASATYSTSICVGQTVAFTINSTDVDSAQNLAISWNNAIPNASFGVNAGSRPSASFSWIPTLADVRNAPYVFTVTVKDDNCPFVGSQTYSYSIQVSGITLTSSVQPVHCNLNGSVNLVATGGQGGYTYQWNPAIGNGPVVSNLAAGSYSCTITDTLGCQASETINIAQGSVAPTVSVSNLPVICHGAATGKASATVSGGQAPYAYQWSTGDTSIAIENIVAGVYNLTVTAANGCVVTASTTITEPAVAFTASSTINNPILCNGDQTASATVNVSGGTPPYSYDWNISTAANLATMSGLGAGNYLVNIADLNGCSAATTVTIAQPAPLVNTVTPTSVSCYGGVDGRAQVVTSGGTGTYIHLWNSVPAQTGTGANNLRAGTYEVITTDQNGCELRTTTTIVEPSLLKTAIATVQPVTCYGGNDGNATIVVTGGTAPYAYFWNTSISQSSASATNLTAGSYNVTVTDLNGCTQISGITIAQPPQLVLSTSESDTICPGQSILIQATATGGTGNYSYSWNSSLGSSQQHTVTPVSSTVYTVQAMDQSGCLSDSAAIAVDVIQFSNSNLNITPGLSICEGATTQLGAVITGTPGNLTWNWGNASWMGAGPYSIQPASSTLYTVTATNNCGMTATASTLITVNPNPNVQLLPQQLMACDQVTLTISDAAVNPGCSYSWDFGNGQTTSGNQVSAVYTQTGDYAITAVATSALGCTDTGTTTAAIVVNQSPVADFSTASPTVSILESTVLFSNQSSPATASWSWDFGDSHTSTEVSPLHTYTDTGEYAVMLIATSTMGCADTLTQFLHVLPAFTLFVPNAFTPNADGNNDVFRAYGDQVVLFNMSIYDRWGKVVYSTDNMNQGWNGYDKNNTILFPQGVYVWKIVVKGNNGRLQEKMGQVTLMN